MSKCIEDQEDNRTILRARRFPDLTTAELSQALQVATTAAERQAARKH